MLGALGFIVLAIVVGLYAYTCSTSYKLVPSREKHLFVSAYSVLALASLVWLSTFFAAATAVPQLVFMSDVLLVIATICILGVLVNLLEPAVLLFVSLIAASLLTLRAFVIPSQAFIGEGLLNFNLTRNESLVIGLIFLIIWLPATIKVVYLAFNNQALLPYRGPISFVFISTVLMTSFFLSARRPIMIILTFISIVIFFSLLTAINIVLEKSFKPAKGGVRHG